MKIDIKKIAAIVQEYTSLNPLESYYRKDIIKSRYIGGFARNTSEMIASIMSPNYRVLDVGSGDGHTLIEHANKF